MVPATLLAGVAAAVKAGADGPALVNAVLTAGALCVALTAIGGFLWFVFGPRIREAVESIAEVKERTTELNPGRTGTTASNAAAAAQAAAELPRLRSLVGRLADEQHVLTEAKLPERVTILEVAQQNTDSRLSAMEQAIIQQLAADAYGAAYGRGRRDERRDT